MSFAKEQIDNLKKTVPMWMAAADRLKGMNKRGLEYDFLCIYHDDTVASFQIYQEDDGTWLGHCAACGVTKNIFQLIQDVDKITFQQAVDIVRKMTETSDWGQKRAAADAVFQRTLAQTKELISFPLSAFDSYVKALQDSPIAQEWLSKRGILPETAELFSLGYVQKPLPSIVPTNHPWYGSGWILFPEIRSRQIVSIKYRSVVGKRIKTDTQQWSGFAARKDMLKSPLYNQDAISPLDNLLVVEGEPDCLVLAQAGFMACAIPSAGFSPTPEMRDALKRSGAVYLAGDTDECGIEAMQKLHRELGGDNPKNKTYMLVWPKPHKDANDFFLKGCGGNIGEFKAIVVQLMDEARNRRLPGIQDLKSVANSIRSFKPPSENPSRLSFPWTSVDKSADILPGEVMLLAATETKSGKSSLLMNILVHNVLAGKKVINFSAELSPERYMQIVTAHLLRKNRNNLTEEDYRAAAKTIPEDSFYIGYKPGAKFSEVMKLLEAAKSTYGGDVFVIDPLHFIIRGSDNENRDFAAAMKALVDFSIQWQVIMIVVGQTRKSMQGNRGKMAQGQDIRGTSAFGEDAATTWILHRNRVGRKMVDDEEGEPVFDNIAKLKLDYTRNNEPRSWKLVFDGTTASFNSFSNQESIYGTTQTESNQESTR